jgi:hypothetical protein
MQHRFYVCGTLCSGKNNVQKLLENDYNSKYALYLLNTLKVKYNEELNVLSDGIVCHRNICWLRQSWQQR